VALRAAFVVALSGRQVAVVVPTTLLARQHFKTFTERFRSFPCRWRRRRAWWARRACRSGRACDGTIDIVIGTHALLGKAIKFRDLALLVVDEEQHFGVSHKERLKTLRAEVHVLTLTATPIPRTLQLALTGFASCRSSPRRRWTGSPCARRCRPSTPDRARSAAARAVSRRPVLLLCPRIEDIAR